MEELYKLVYFTPFGIIHLLCSYSFAFERFIRAVPCVAFFSQGMNFSIFFGMYAFM